MASGHANRANRPNTWLHRPTCDVKIPLANSEPSTHGTKRTSDEASRTSATDPKPTPRVTVIAAWLEGEDR
jgi:hypothetical protein